MKGGLLPAQALVVLLLLLPPSRCRPTDHHGRVPCPPCPAPPRARPGTRPPHASTPTHLCGGAWEKEGEQHAQRDEQQDEDAGLGHAPAGGAVLEEGGTEARHLGE